MITKSAYRDAMARFGSAVNVITSDGIAGRCGFTASAVCSVTDEPPTLLVCINRTSDSHSIIIANRVLCVNTLSANQQALSPLFGGQIESDAEARFAAATWDVLETGSPVLREATVAFDCRIVQITEIGTHSVLFCEVVAMREGPVHEGLIYFGRDYHAVRRSAPGR